MPSHFVRRMRFGLPGPAFTPAPPPPRPRSRFGLAPASVCPGPSFASGLLSPPRPPLPGLTQGPALLSAPGSRLPLPAPLPASVPRSHPGPGLLSALAATLAQAATPTPLPRSLPLPALLSLPLLPLSGSLSSCLEGALWGTGTPTSITQSRVGQICDRVGVNTTGPCVARGHPVGPTTVTSPGVTGIDRVDEETQ